MSDFFRTVYKLEIRLLSPLAIGSGANENTDKDVIVNSAGEPFIPASSLAGVLRSGVVRRSGSDTGNAVFGYIPIGKNDPNKKQDSIVRFYDGLFSGGSGGSYYITNRDMVKLEEKVGVKGAKFDMQAVETGASFTAYIELLRISVEREGVKIDPARELEAALAEMNAGILRLGAKTTRGYGQVGLTVWKKEFSEVAQWLDFDMMDPAAWSEKSLMALACAPVRELRLGLRLKGGVSIREYTTEPSTEKETMPDYKQLSLHTVDENGEPIPVIPGTSWAGAIKSRFFEFCGSRAETEALFGFMHDKKRDGDDKVMKSRVVFSESQLRGGVWKTATRNAIDRFSGGTKDSALYTERTWFGGTCELTISFTDEPSEKELLVLCACLADLNNGFLAVGGLTSVGRGVFEIVKVGENELSDAAQAPERIFETLKEEVGLHG